MKARYELPTVNALKVLECAYAGLSALQSYTPAEQAAAVAVLFTEIASRIGISVSELIDKAERMAQHADTNYTTTLRSLREYIKQELR
jgi:hypothetical protein